MPLLEALPLTPATAQWPVWSTTARLVVTDPQQLPDARAIALKQLAAVELACSRFRADSELMQLPTGSQVQVSPLLARLVDAALRAARFTAGAVTPTVGNALSALGYDRDWSRIAASSTPAAAFRVQPAPDWRQVRLNGTLLTVPRGIRLDLGATAKALTADLIAEQIATRLPVGVLIALGGDIATAGPVPPGRWSVLVQDVPGDPAVTVALAPDGAIATSSTQSRSWTAGQQRLHHILDPRSCRPAEPVWRTATVAASSCLAANVMSTAALVLGHEAPDWLRAREVPARLVGADGDVIRIGGFPKGVDE